jgi:hypothetical protein
LGRPGRRRGGRVAREGDMQGARLAAVQVAHSCGTDTTACTAASSALMRERALEAAVHAVVSVKVRLAEADAEGQDSVHGCFQQPVCCNSSGASHGKQAATFAPTPQPPNASVRTCRQALTVTTLSRQSPNHSMRSRSNTSPAR